MFVSLETLTATRWDDWVPEDRLRKLTDENQELARSLKKEMDALAKQKATPKPISTNPTVKRKDGSARGSEERGTGPGKKRGRDFDTERVSRAVIQCAIPYLLITIRRRHSTPNQQSESSCQML